MRLVLSRLVEDWGYEAVVVDDGLAAIDCLSRPNGPGLALLDWEMPGLNGPEICRRIHARQPGEPRYLILLTAREGQDHVVHGLEAGADDYVTKPFNHAELRARVDVGQRVLQLQCEVAAANAILEAERRVIEDIFLSMREQRQFDKRHVRDLQVPVERTSGDVFFSAFREDGAQHVLLGDFTGHGLSAAIGGPMVSDVFYTMTRKGFVAEAIVAEINSRLLEKLPTGLFLAAVMLSISPDRSRGSVINCGMQDVLVFRHHQEQMRIPSENLALGILADAPITEHGLGLQEGDRLFVYSDGLIEVEDPAGTQFGVNRLSRTLSGMLRRGDSLEALKSAVVEFAQLDKAPDDITLAEITC